MENSFTDEQKARLYGAFLDWPAGEKEHIVSAMGKITAIAERICDGAAYYLIEWGLASSEFDMDAPEPERDKQIEIIREEIRKRYPAATEPTRTKEISG